MEFYETFCKGEIFTTNSATAELVKLTENAYRDVNIAFANELSLVANKVGVNIIDLIKLSNKHPRVNILSPGCGVGGHCIAIDPWFIISKQPDISKLMRVSREVNEEKTNWVIKKILSGIREFKRQNKRKPVIFCYGLTFKPDVEDVRESPSIRVVQALLDKNEIIYIVEPNIKTYKDWDLINLNTSIYEHGI